MTGTGTSSRRRRPRWPRLLHAGSAEDPLVVVRSSTWNYNSIGLWSGDEVVLVDPGLAPAELALAWCRDRPYNAVVVTGTTTVQQCEEAIRAFKLEALPRELLDAVDAIHERYRSPDAALHSKEQVLREEPPASCAIV